MPSNDVTAKKSGGKGSKATRGKMSDKLKNYPRLHHSPQISVVLSRVLITNHYEQLIKPRQAGS